MWRMDDAGLRDDFYFGNELGGIIKGFTNFVSCFYFELLNRSSPKELTKHTMDETIFTK